MLNQHHKTAHVHPRNNLPEYVRTFTIFHEVMYKGFTSETLKDQKSAHATLSSYQRELARHLYFLDNLKHTAKYVNEEDSCEIEP